MNKINLICLPYAGGGRSAYYHYTAISPKELNILTIELPGRGARYGEAPLCDIQMMVDDILRQVRRKLDQPYAIYGHSMGAILAYLLAGKIDSERLNPPLHLFLTGSGGPSMVQRERKLSDLGRSELTETLKEMGGIPDEILKNEHHLDIFLPILRADFKAIDNFEYVQREKLNVPLSVITGSEEDVSVERAEAWRKETSATVDIRRLPGNHFFIFDYGSTIIELIVNALFPRVSN